MLLNPSLPVVGKSMAFADAALLMMTAIPRVITSVETAGYYNAGDRGGSKYYRVANGAALPGAIQSRDGAWWALNTDTPNVRMFGAVGDGVADDTNALVTGDAYAFSRGLPTLALTKGTFSIRPIVAKVGWVGDNMLTCILKYRGELVNGVLTRAPGFYPLVQSLGVNGVRFAHFTCDGWVSADPAQWTKANYDAFLGAAGLSVENCDSASVEFYRGMNVRQHGLKFSYVTNGRQSFIRVNKMRGNFGDGVFNASCQFLTADNIVAYDYTRIGYVVDAYGDDVKGCQKVAINKLSCSYGHDGSVAYGGGEYNTGLWCEHTADVTVEQSFFVNNRDRQMVICTGSRDPQFVGSYSAISVTDVQCIGPGELGAALYSLGPLPVRVTVRAFSTRGSITGLYFTASNPTDMFDIDGSAIEYDASNSNGRGIACDVSSGAAGGKPSFVIGAGVKFSRYAVDFTKLNDSGDNAVTADIGGYFSPGAPMRLTLKGPKTANDTPVYVRWYDTLTHDLEVDGGRYYFSRGGSGGGNVRISGARIDRGMLNYGIAKTLKVMDCEITGAFYAGGTKVTYQSDFETTDASAFVWLFTDTFGKKPYAKVGGQFSKDPALGHALRLGFGNQGFSANIMSATFYNPSNTVENTKPFIMYAVNASLYFSSVLADSSVATVARDENGFTPIANNTSGITSASYH